MVDFKTRTVMVMLKATFHLKAIGDDEPGEKAYAAEYVYTTGMNEIGGIVVKMGEF